MRSVAGRLLSRRKRATSAGTSAARGDASHGCGRDLRLLAKQRDPRRGIELAPRRDHARSRRVDPGPHGIPPRRFATRDAQRTAQCRQHVVARFRAHAAESPAAGAACRGAGRGAPPPRLPLALKRAALRRRQVAIGGPAARERQRTEMPLAATDQMQGPHGDAGRGPVELRPRREIAPELEPAAHRGGRQVSLELALAPVPHQLRQRNAHRADRLAAAAERGGVGQMRGFVDPDEGASGRLPSDPDRSSHRHGRRPSDRPGSGSCRRRSGCSGASPRSSCRAWRNARCRSARRDIRPGRRGPRGGAARSRTSCRPTSPGPWPSAPARGAAGSCPPASARASRSKRVRYGLAAEAA